MRCETTVWMSAALVVATTALHLTIDHGLHSDKSSTFGLDTSTEPSIASGPAESVARAEAKAGEDGDQATTNMKTLEENGPSAESDTSNSPESEDNGASAETGIISPQEPEDYEPEVEAGPTSPPEPEDEPGAEAGATSSTKPEDNGLGAESGTTSPLIPEDNVSDAESGTTSHPESEDNGPSDEAETTSPPEPEDNGPGSEAGSTTPPESENNGSGAEGGTTSPPESVDTIIVTSTGRVRGHMWRQNANILSYLDIKYGIFSNLFEAPVFPEADENSVHDERVHNKRCPQFQGEKIVGDPDCLTLSIFKPFKAELTGASVLVHIHEGNFINESADPEIYGPEYLVSEEIILVLPNYRLGPLGFLCLQNETAPGNAALKDLALALRWIKKNIENFGGDPEKITVSGAGTAGALAGYLALSPMSKSNVNKVITESGSVLSHWAIDRNPIVTAMNLANCINGPWETWQSIDMEELLLAGRNIDWRPCLENNEVDGEHFMVETPWAMLQKEDNKVTFMIGSAEYAGVHESLSHTEDSIQELDANVTLLLPNDLQFETSEERSEVGNKVKAQYFEDAITHINVINRTLYYTDVAYLGPVIRTARSLVNSGSTVYFYEFSFVGTLNRELIAVENQADGAVRGDIIGYLFYQEGDLATEGTQERKMIEQLLQFWTSFLKTGTPKTEDIEWNKFEKTFAAQERWLSISKETAMKSGVHEDRLGLWTDIYNEHFIDRSLGLAVSSSVYTVLFLQVVFFITVFTNAWHFF